MTPAERVYAAIGRREIPGFVAATYNCHPLSWGSHAADPAYAPILEALQRGTVCWLCKVPVDSRGAGAGEEVQETRDGDTTVRTVTRETPRGPLVQVTRTPPGQPSMCVKHFLHTGEDIERYLSLGGRLAETEWKVDQALARAREIGDRGVAYVAYRDPFYQVSELFDQEEFLVRCIADPGLIERLVEREAEAVIEETRALLQAFEGCGERLLFYTAGPERATPPLLPPRIFARLIVPHQRRLVALIHDYGHPVCLHCHGRIRAVLDGAMECGFDAVEPLEPPPQGDIALEELVERTEGRMALMGYVQDQDLYTLSAGEVRERVRGIAATVRGRRGYVCCPTCTPFSHPPSERYVANYLAFLDEAQRV